MKKSYKIAGNIASKADDAESSNILKLSLIRKVTGSNLWEMLS